VLAVAGGCALAAAVAIELATGDPPAGANYGEAEPAMWRGDEPVRVPEIAGEDGEPHATGVIHQPCQRLPSHHWLTVVPPVLVKQLGNVSQLIGSRFG
jgi:hypothetical protein